MEDQASMNDQQQRRYLEIELVKAKAEAAALRKQLHLNSRHAKRIDRAYEDALLLAAWRAAGIFPSRQHAKKHGMPRAFCA